VNGLISIFAVSAMSAVDGPGRRVVVFFQGCDVNCAWCHSPHSRASCSPLIFHEHGCSMCMRCRAACERNVHKFKDGKHLVQRERCQQCGKCIEACPESSVYKESGVLRLPTRKLTADALLTQVLPYLSLCDGITLSGGEALLQDDTLRFLRLCREEGIHTCVETSGLLESDRYVQTLPFVDVWLFGMRVLTDNDLRFHTDKIIENARIIGKAAKNIIPVVPLVPGVMNRSDVLAQIILVLNVIGAVEIQLNPWNRSYDVYYASSGIKPVFPRPSEEAIEKCENEVRAFFMERGYKLIERRAGK